MLCCRASGCETGVHPHSRGENRGGLEVCRQLRGSSPLARGKCTARYGCRFSSRFIPTRAGKIMRSPPHPLSQAVHPHSRGENEGPRAARPVDDGSSPLARGKFCSQNKPTATRRFIPTRAGKITRRRTRYLPLPVHPHSRGENPVTCTILIWVPGSSPLARGKSYRGY